jgi:hypothetical protein
MKRKVSRADSNLIPIFQQPAFPWWQFLAVNKRSIRRSDIPNGKGSLRGLSTFLASYLGVLSGSGGVVQDYILVNEAPDTPSATVPGIESKIDRLSTPRPAPDFPS